MSTTTRPPAAGSRLSVGAFVVANVYVFLTLGLLIWVVVPAMFLGLRPTVIASGSMAPLIERGDIVMIERSRATDGPLDPGAVVTYHDPYIEAMVTHRVVDVVDEGYVTRGDANRADDPRVVAFDAVAGHGRLLVPFLGLPLLWLREGAWLLLGLWALATLWAIDTARSSPETAAGIRGPDVPAGAPSPAGAPVRERLPRLRVDHLGVVVLLVAGALTLPGSEAAFVGIAANLQSSFEIAGPPPTPQTLYAQADGSWTTTAPPADAETSLRLDPGAFAMVPVTTTSVDATFADDTTLDVYVRRRGQPGPRTLHVALLWGSEVVRATVTATPGNQQELWTVTLPTAGRTIPAGTALSLAYELDSASTDRLDIWFGGAAMPTALTFPDTIS